MLHAGGDIVIINAAILNADRLNLTFTIRDETADFNKNLFHWVHVTLKNFLNLAYMLLNDSVHRKILNNK